MSDVEIQDSALSSSEYRNRRRFVTDAWLDAGKELMAATCCEVGEKDGAFELRLSVPGFQANEIQVTALPDVLVIAAESSYGHKDEKKNVRYCELAGRSLFRTIKLPEPIETKKVTTELKDGILRIMARKASFKPIRAMAAA